MPSQKFLLRVILWSLGAAAVIGAAGVLWLRSDAVVRVDLTLVLAAICSAMILAVTRKLASPADQRAAGLATTIVAVEFILGLVAIWAENFFGRWQEGALETMAALGGAGIPAVAFLRLEQNPLARIAARVGLAICAAVFSLWMIGIWSFRTSWDGWTWFGYGHTLGATGILAVVALVGLGKDRWHWRWIGIACAVAAFVVAVPLVNANAGHVQLLTLLITVAFVVAHANLALRCPLKARQQWLAYSTVAAVMAVGVFVNLGMIEERHPQRSRILGGYDRFASASGILSACGTLALVILYRINQRAIPATLKSGELGPVIVICPVCQRKESVSNGLQVCGGCGLRIHVQVEEPRCLACGYSLLMLKSDRCPECGATVGRSAGQWADTTDDPNSVHGLQGGAGL